jgi:peptidoglycan/LPS O-acetylase OafA/YrhL
MPESCPHEQADEAQMTGERFHMDFHDRHFKNIQALRGIAAVLVVLEHVRFLNCGAFGVDIFFCISGFMIMFSTHKSSEHFLSKRLIRILPLYYLMTLFTFVLLVLFPGSFETSSASAGSLLKSLLFIPFDIGNGVLQPLMRIGWTINCELFFYLLIFLSLRLSHRFRGAICSALIALLVLAAQFFGRYSVVLTFYGDPVMLEFIFGIICYYAAWGFYRLYQTGRLPKICPAVSLPVIIGILLYFLITKPTINALGFMRPLLWGLPAAVLVFSFVLSELVLTLPGSLVRLGDISFSLYLLHYYPVMFLDRSVFDFGSFSLRSLAGLVLALVISVSLSLVSHELIEKRFSRFLLRKLLNRA